MNFPTSESELECIREQIEDNLFPHVLINVDVIVQFVHLEHKVNVGLLHNRRESVAYFLS